MIVKSCTLIIFILGKLKRDSTIDKQSPYKDFTLAESFSILSLAEILQLRSGYYLSRIEGKRRMSYLLHLIIQRGNWFSIVKSLF